MFSGIVQELGRVRANAGGRLSVRAAGVVSEARTGDSVAVSGCCLTVVQLDPDGFVADVVPETARRTTIGALSPGDPVNLEASMRLSDVVGGHLVTGHVDEVGDVQSVDDDANARRVTIAAPEKLLWLVAERGSIAVDGISLTVTGVSAEAFSVSLIPHTIEITTAGSWTVGSRVNLEADVIARYVHRSLLGAGVTLVARETVSEARRHVPVSAGLAEIRAAGRLGEQRSSVHCGFVRWLAPARRRVSSAGRRHNRTTASREA